MTVQQKDREKMIAAQGKWRGKKKKRTRQSRVTENLQNKEKMRQEDE